MRKRLFHEVLKSLNERYNLDAPVIVQYKDYMVNLLQGDFGPRLDIHLDP